MANWFEVKIKYAKISEQGIERMVSEPYLVDAMSFTEAEARICKEMEAFLGGEFQVVNIKRANYTDLFPFDGADKWYRCRVFFVTIDEEKGMEKRKGVNMLVQASDLKSGLENLSIGLKDMTIDYDVTAITETPIMDVFPWYANDDVTE